MTIATAVGNGTVAIGATGETVIAIQMALRASGAELIPDGEFGTATQSAVKTFQAAHNLAVVGYVGPKTAAALDAVAVTAPSPILLPSVKVAAPHLAEMRAITGTKEVPGGANSPIIMSWRGDIAQAFPEMASYAAGYTGDAIPWCGFGLAGCFARRKLRPVFGKTDTQRFMWAAAWGHESAELVVLKAPYPAGAIMVYTRNGGGHVSLLEEAGDGFDNIRGCNQSDMVNVVAKSREQFTAATWPRNLPIPTVAAPRAKVRGKVSGKES